jgi:cytoskeleton protein RodZ
MVANIKSLSFGRYLKTVRLEKGIDLEEVAEETKVGMDYLLLIEKEDHDRLPASVFVKGFLRAYAQAIGADGEEVVKLYTASRQTFEDTAEFDADIIRAGQAFWPRLLIFLGLFLGIIVMSVFVISIVNDRPAGDDSKLNVPKEINRDRPFKDVPEPNVVNKQFNNVSEKLLLKLVTVEDTWMKITVDRQSPREYSLRPGDLLEFEASLGYNILIGNAAGVQLTLNGKPVEIMGKHGQVKHVQIP